MVASLRQTPAPCHTSIGLYAERGRLLNLLHTALRCFDGLPRAAFVVTPPVMSLDSDALRELGSNREPHDLPGAEFLRGLVAAAGSLISRICL